MAKKILRLKFFDNTKILNALIERNGDDPFPKLFRAKLDIKVDV